jgi:hypothetical protein
MDREYSGKKKSGHLEFRTKLALQLMSYSSSSNYTLPVDGQGFCTNLKNAVQPGSTSQCGSHIVLLKDAKDCKACMAANRVVQGVKRKALEELSVNSVQWIRTEETDEDLGSLGHGMAVQFVRFISVEREIAGLSIYRRKEWVKCTKWLEIHFQRKGLCTLGIKATRCHPWKG